MIIKLFRDNQVFAVLICFFIAVFVWLITGFLSEYDPSTVAINYSPVFQVFPFFEEINNYQAIAAFLNALMLFLSGLYFSGIIQRFQIIPRRTALPMFIFIVLSIPYFKSYNGFSYPLLTFLVLLIILGMIFGSIDSKNTNFRFFDSALLLSTVSLLNVYFLFYLLFLVFVWIQFRAGYWREIVFLIIGLVLPYAFYIAVLYLLDKDFSSAFYVFAHRGELALNLKIPSIYNYFGIFLIVFLGISSVHIIRSYGKMKILTRKYSLIFLSFFLTTVLTLIIFRAIDSDFIFYLALPVSFLFSFYFSTCRTNIFNQVLFAIIVVSHIAIVLIN